MAGQQADLPEADSPLQIARGKTPGMSHILKFGRNIDIDTAATEDIWDAGGLYVPPTAARIHNIVSSSVQDAGTLLSTGTITSPNESKIIDTSATFSTDTVSVGDIVLNDDTQDHSIVTAVDSETQLTVKSMHHGTANAIGNTYRIVTSAGTGAVVTHIKQGLDANFETQTEFVILNGTTNVATVNSYYRINRFHIHGVGSNKSNTGTITATAVTDATVTAQISIGKGQSLMAFFTIPKGQNGYITSLYSTLNRAGGSGRFADMALYERLWGDVGAGGDGELIFNYFTVNNGGTGFIKNYNPYLYVSEYSDVWIRCESVSANNSDISAGFDLILVDK